MKHLPKLFVILAIILTIIMFVVVGYNYHMLANGVGNSAPPETAFLLAIPYLIGISVCIVLAVFIKKKVYP